MHRTDCCHEKKRDVALSYTVVYDSMIYRNNSGQNSNFYSVHSDICSSIEIFGYLEHVATRVDIYARVCKSLTELTHASRLITGNHYRPRNLPRTRGNRHILSYSNSLPKQNSSKSDEKFRQPKGDIFST